MKDSLQPGLRTTRKFEIDKPRTIDFLGEELRVYATPELIRDIEITCRDFLLDHADDGEDSVGTSVNVTHAGATPLGMTVEITAIVTVVQGRQVQFEVTVRDDVEEVATGIHSRFMVEVEKLRGRIGAKVEKAKKG